VRNEEVLLRVKGLRNIPYKRKRKKTNWIGHILRRNCHLRHFIEGKVEAMVQVTGRREAGRKQLLDFLKEGEDTGI
jgi:hypothetical protein